MTTISKLFSGIVAWLGLSLAAVQLTREGRRALGREMARVARDLETARLRKVAVRD